MTHWTRTKNSTSTTQLFTRSDTKIRIPIQQLPMRYLGRRKCEYVMYKRHSDGIFFVVFLSPAQLHGRLWASCPTAEARLHIVSVIPKIMFVCRIICTAFTSFDFRLKYGFETSVSRFESLFEVLEIRSKYGNYWSRTSKVWYKYNPCVILWFMITLTDLKHFSNIANRLR